MKCLIFNTKQESKRIALPETRGILQFYTHFT